jgi:hypothetical protein
MERKRQAPKWILALHPGARKCVLDQDARETTFGQLEHLVSAGGHRRGLLQSAGGQNSDRAKKTNDHDI